MRCWPSFKTTVVSAAALAYFANPRLRIPPNPHQFPPWRPIRDSQCPCPRPLRASGLRAPCVRSHERPPRELSPLRPRALRGQRRCSGGCVAPFPADPSVPIQPASAHPLPMTPFHPFSCASWGLLYPPLFFIGSTASESNRNSTGSYLPGFRSLLAQPPSRWPHPVAVPSCSSGSKGAPGLELRGGLLEAVMRSRAVALAVIQTATATRATPPTRHVHSPGPHCSSCASLWQPATGSSVDAEC